MHVYLQNLFKVDVSARPHIDFGSDDVIMY
jgi:hypothetical protein